MAGQSSGAMAYSWLTFGEPCPVLGAPEQEEGPPGPQSGGVQGAHGLWTCQAPVLAQGAPGKGKK